MKYETSFFFTENVLDATKENMQMLILPSPVHYTLT